MRLPTLLLLALTLVLNACSTRIDDYRSMQPELDLRQFFNGRVDAWGQFQDRSGKVVKRFTVVMNCHWQGNKGTLVEDFRYDDGSTQQRIWTLDALPDGRYRGRAADVVGEAAGQARGPALQWTYTLSLPVDGKTYEVRFNDWMYLHDDQTMVNRAVMSKFGLRLGEVTLFFRKADKT